MKLSQVCENCGNKYTSNNKNAEIDYCPICGYDSTKDIFRISDLINQKLFENKIPEDTKLIIAHEYL